jgi:predicted outer membrane protein
MRNFRGIRLAIVAVLCVVPVAVSACGDVQGHIQAIKSAAATGTAHIPRVDRSWIGKEHQANVAEMETGRLAELDGGGKAIRSAGAVLARDHKALDSKLISVAEALKVRLPRHLTVQQITTHDRLSKEKGHRFDHDFTASMMTAHQSMIGATRYEIAHGSSAQVVTLAQQTLPVLEKHLKMLQAAAPSG